MFRYFVMDGYGDTQKAFVPGQRWISLTEPELGLGLVVQVLHRHVQVLFPGGGETRAYAADNAPLKRVHFAPGDCVRGHEGAELTITSVHEQGGLFTYIGEGGSLEESALCDSLSFDDPEARFLSGHVDATELFELRMVTLRHQHEIQQSPVRGFVGARIELLPHQLYVAHEVSRRQLPRVLLADEVGLGKTIEACLILHRMILCGTVRRALVLVPSPLIHQWFVELLRRFNLAFSIINETHYAEQLASGCENPFEEPSFVLCDIDMLVRSKAIGMQALAVQWDMLIVDEAHHLQWSEQEVSREYYMVEQFAKVVPGLLLLTASPEQAGEAGHFARLRLLDPARYSDFQSFLSEQTHYAHIAGRAEKLIAEKSEAELADYLDRHGPGRVIFRNTRAGMSAFPKRVPHVVALTPCDDEVDARVVWLAGFLRDNPGIKVLVICHSSREVKGVRDALQSRVRVDIATFHEKLPLLQCDRQAAWFAEPDGPQVLITSGVGGEGRNFQFVNHMVLMDIPNDPEFVEQRIGRLDRIGQHHDIHIHVPYIEGSAEAGRVRWLHEGLNAFSRPLVGGYRMLLEFGPRLGCVTDDLVAETRRSHDDLCREIAVGRDRLLELNSCRHQIADKLVEAIRESDGDILLRDYMSDLFELFGVGVEALGDSDFLLKPDLLYCEEFPLPRDSMRITYDRDYALSRPTVTLLSWDHPMVQGAMELILGTDRGTGAVSRSRECKSAILQSVFVLEPVSEHRRSVARFLPCTPIVTLVDEALAPVEALPAIDSDGESWESIDEIRKRRETLPAMLSASRKHAESGAQQIAKKAREAMRYQLGAESRRLRALHVINDHIRPEEISAMDAQADAFEQAICEARLRLDSVRLVVPG
ncbi:MAG: DEAD/DEAH box helicase family protein [Kiritimatiellae bacterium]|nr:DEAD/DEAH box helicase family protein [Kiritimatiellia bacterium]